MSEEKLQGVKFATPTFRLSYPHLIKVNKFNNYAITMLFDEDQDIAPIKKAIVGALKEKFGNKKELWKKVKKPLKKGDNMSDVGEEYQGKIVLDAKTKDRPPVMLNRDKTPCDPQTLYAGCYCQAALTAKAVKSGSQWFITMYLQAIRFIKDGEPLGGSFDSDIFEDLEDDVDSIDGSDDFDSEETESDDLDEFDI